MNKTLKVILTILLITTVLFIQFFIIKSNSLFGIKPNLILCMLTVFTLYFGLEKVGIFAILNGFILDIMYGSTNFGIYTIIYSLNSIIIGKLKENFKLNVFSCVYVMIISSFAFEAVECLTLAITSSVHVNIFIFLFRTMLFAFFNSAISIIMYNLINKIFSIGKSYEYF